MNKLQKIYLSIYRIAAFGLLFSMLGAIAIYGSLLVFYITSDKWAMPANLSANHQDVIRYVPSIIGLENNLNDAKIRLDAAKEASKMLAAKGELMGLDVKDVNAELGGNLITRDVANLRKAIIIDAEVKELEVNSRIPSLEYTIDNTSKALETASASAHFQAKDSTVHIAFVPYGNIEHAKVGDKTYNCMLKVVACYESGSIKQIYPQEAYAPHPIFKTPVKGQMIEVEYKDNIDSHSDIIYVGSKPLLF